MAKFTASNLEEPMVPDQARPTVLDGFSRYIESLQTRIDGLDSGVDAGPEEMRLVLDSTTEELRVAVEQIRETDDALRESRAEVEAERKRYRDLFDQAPDAYLVTSLEGAIQKANHAASVVLNIGSPFLVGKPLIVFLPEEGRPAFRSELARLARSTGVQEYDLRLKPRQLPPVDAAVRVSVDRDPWGRAVALLWTIRDVSARRRAEEKIRSLNSRLERKVVERTEQLEDSLQANERWLIQAHAAEAEARLESGLFQGLVEGVDAILWRADAETGRYAFVSRRAEELLGFPTSSWIDHPEFWAERLHPEDREWAIAHRRKQLREGKDYEAEYRMVAADGRAFWFRESVRVARPGTGRTAGSCGLMVNITKRKKLERQLYTAKGELALRIRDLTYLRELDARLATSRGWRATLDEILSAMTSLQGTDMAMVLIRERGGPGMSVAATVGLPEELTRLLGDRAHDLGILGQPLSERKSVVIEDLEAEPVELGGVSLARVGGIRGLFAVPLFNEEWLGVAVACFRASHRPPEGQVRLVEMYLRHAAEAIEAVRRFDRLEAAEQGKSRDLAEIKASLAEIRAAVDRLEIRDDGPTEQIRRQVLVLQGLIDKFD
ncbi:PAS domain S-box protein [Tundrisphaera lichenicola]|uniref:PAS domain S-box protein n=1 Tax=Tundrisphaera lichenicola TaxID=2029860 RepID=UPI003EB8902F